MELYLGGYAQNKLEYVQKNCGKKEIWNDFHLYVKNELLNGKTQEEISEEVENRISKNPELIIISDEIGNGIVPVSESDRLYRETTGRILCEVAEQANKVVRIVCGIPQVLK